MKHRTWFRLALKAIGVLLVGWSLDSVFYIGGMVYTLATQPRYLDQFNPYSNVAGSPPDNSVWFTLKLLEYLSPLLIGLYLVFGGKWLLNKMIPADRPYCPACGYDLSHSHGSYCPECGEARERSGSTDEPTENEADAS